MNTKNLSRRNFVRKVAGASAAMVAVPHLLSAKPEEGKRKRNKKLKSADSPLNLKYAPSFGLFKELAGTDPIDYIKFCHDMGFRAVFDNRITGRPVEEQVKIANELDRLGMELGPFVLYADFKTESFVLDKPEIRDMLRAKMLEGMESAKRVNAKTMLVVPGKLNAKLHIDYQTSNVIENLKRCSEIVEPSGIVMVLEPLNSLTNHPGLFLKGIPQSHMICEAVDSPACKIVNDIYHQQITEGNIIPNIDMAWESIAAFHTGDNPGRKEPTSGEINYKNVFKHIYDKGYQGVLCMEHGKSMDGIEGEKRVIEAYRECDDFLG